MTQVEQKWSVFGTVSICLAVVVALLIINFFGQVVQISKLQGLPVLLPVLTSPVGVILGLIGFRKNKDKLSLWGLITNCILFVVPFVYWFLGVLIWGP